MVNDLDYEDIQFSVPKKKGFSSIEHKNNICINVLCYENDLTYLVYVSNEKCENSMDLLMIIGKNVTLCLYQRF